MLVKRTEIDVGALFDSGGRYRYLNGVNVPAILSVAIGVGVYYSLPHAWLKVLWGVGVGAVAYLVLTALARPIAQTGMVASSQRSSSPS